MSQLYTKIAEQLQGALTNAQGQLTGEIAIGHIWDTFCKLVEKAVLIAQQWEVIGRIKKELVLATLEKFYDEVIEPLDIPLVPAYLETSVIDPMIKQTMLSVAGRLIDKLVTKFNTEGWPDESKSD